MNGLHYVLPREGQADSRPSKPRKVQVVDIAEMQVNKLRAKNRDVGKNRLTLGINSIQYPDTPVFLELHRLT
ncbi:hypothetical protein AOLI_G00131090 [Acnodon oligacanthus]